jgi:hypothetical protein
MHGAQQFTPLLAVHVAAAEDRHRALREAARQAHLTNKRERALDKAAPEGPAPDRRGIGAALVYISARLMGKPAISIHG